MWGFSAVADPTPTLHLCVPVLKRYDKLAELLQSAAAGTRVPDHVWVIDNGNNPKAMWAVCGVTALPITVHAPRVNLGLAASWNWFLRMVYWPAIWAVTPTLPLPLICNDDITFAPESIAKILATSGGFVSPLAGSNAFSCFMLPYDTFYRVGTFDETLSPGYAYFEDNDYAHRMEQAGIPITPVDCGVRHAVSSTFAAYSPEEKDAHHKRFDRAQKNYIAKWGGLPHQETR